MVQMTLIQGSKRMERQKRGLPLHGYVVLHGDRYLVGFRDYARFRSIKLRADGEPGVHLVETERRLLSDAARLIEFLQGEVTVL